MSADCSSWHGGNPYCFKLECLVPALTLGAFRRFLIKPIEGGKSMTLISSPGDLVVVGGRSQHHWLDCVYKEPLIPDARISVDFMIAGQAVRDH